MRTTIRALDAEVMNRLRSFCLSHYGTYYGHEGEIISRAVASYLDGQQQQHEHYAPLPSDGLDPRVEARISQIKRHVENFLGEGSTGQIPTSDLKVCIKKSGIKDRRQIRRYLYEYLPGKGFVSQLNPFVHQISPSWIPSIKLALEITETKFDGPTVTVSGIITPIAEAP